LIKRADESMYDIKAKYKKSKVSNIWNSTFYKNYSESSTAPAGSKTAK
jgi:hypothetical protein